jgi:hybrid cluster-associated redox disulfide protein
MPVESHQVVDDIMRKQPRTIAVFLQFRMLCVGCPIAPFHSLEEACQAHGIDQELLIAQLEAAMDGGAG